MIKLDFSNVVWRNAKTLELATVTAFFIVYFGVLGWLYMRPVVYSGRILFLIVTLIISLLGFFYCVSGILKYPFSKAR